MSGGIKMEDGCGRLLAFKVIKDAAASVTSHSASADENVAAPMYILRTKWTKDLIMPESFKPG